MKFIELRDIKGRLALEDLKIIPNIPSSTWDPLVEDDLVIVSSNFRKTQELQTHTVNVQTQPFHRQTKSYNKRLNL